MLIVNISSSLKNAPQARNEVHCIRPSQCTHVLLTDINPIQLMLRNAGLHSPNTYCIKIWSAAVVPQQPLILLKGCEHIYLFNRSILWQTPLQKLHYYITLADIMHQQAQRDWLQQLCIMNIFWCVHRNMPMTLKQMQEIFILLQHICTHMCNKIKCCKKHLLQHLLYFLHVRTALIY